MHILYFIINKKKELEWNEQCLMSKKGTDHHMSIGERGTNKTIQVSWTIGFLNWHLNFKSKIIKKVLKPRRGSCVPWEWDWYGESTRNPML